MSELQELKNRLYNRNHATRDLLGGIETPVRSPSQEITNEDHIERLNEIILNANTDLLDIEADHKNNIEAAELEAFRISLYDIERECPQSTMTYVHGKQKSTHR